MSDFIRRDICEGVAFSSVNDDRFKISRLGASLVVPLDKKNAAANSLTASILTRSCKKYPDFTIFGKKLKSLYDASVYTSVSKLGGYQIINFYAKGLDDKYTLYNESLSAELAELLCSVIFDPNLSDGLFPKEDVEQERRLLLDDIDTDFNDKRVYAKKRCIEKMFVNHPFSISEDGTKEDVQALTNDDLYSAWKNLIHNSRVELTMLGAADPEKAFEGFRSNFENKPRSVKKLEFPDVVPSEVRRYAETEEVTQSKLVMGLRCPYPKTNLERNVNSLMSAVLGGTTTSKLFVNVREKKGLCYYCFSTVNNYQGAMFIESGVETANIEKAEKAVIEQLDELQNGIITDEEIFFAKLALKNAFISALDNLSVMQTGYINGVVGGNGFSPLESAKMIESITKEQIVEAAKKVKLDTVFSLIGN